MCPLSFQTTSRSTRWQLEQCLSRFHGKVDGGFIGIQGRLAGQAISLLPGNRHYLEFMIILDILSGFVHLPNPESYGIHPNVHPGQTGTARR